MSFDNSIDKAVAAERESKHIEFKSKVDFSEPGTWCEIIKDIIAMANSGGGAIVIGCDNNGSHVAADLSSVLSLDPATITDQIYKYTGVHFSGFDIVQKTKRGHRVAIIVVCPVTVPIVFAKPGSYRIDDRTQKTAFSAGTIYFRHGAKSEPGNTDDIRSVFEKQMEIARKTWLTGMKKVVASPPGSQVYTFPPSVEIRESLSSNAKAIRIVDDPDVPAYRKLNPDISYPKRQKNVIEEVNSHLPDADKINLYDIQCIKRLYSIESNEAFCHRSKFTGFPQYNKTFIDWLIVQYQKDKQFFFKCREKILQIKLSIS
jgi:hypothetical protein